MSLEPLSWPAKDKDAKLVYALDWTDWLEPGETIVTAVWTVTGADVITSSISNGTQTRIVLGGGTIGVSAIAKVHVTSSANQEDDRTVNIEITEK